MSAEAPLLEVRDLVQEFEVRGLGGVRPRPAFPLRRGMASGLCRRWSF